jgi:hypothetical protein
MMKKVKLTRRETETLLWLIEKHRKEVIEKLDAEQDAMMLKLLVDYNMLLHGLTDKLNKLVETWPGRIPYKTKDDRYVKGFFSAD